MTAVHPDIAIKRAFRVTQKRTWTVVTERLPSGDTSAIYDLWRQIRLS